MQDPIPVHITTFRPEHAAGFDALNRAWLVQYGLLEAADEPALTNPEGEILAHGGQIFVALREQTVVGTCALVPRGEHAVELAKLAVVPTAKGHGLGRRLAETALTHALRAGARRVVLLSSSRLTTALRLYESLGFRYASVPEDQPYASADVYMELDLDTATHPFPPPETSADEPVGDPKRLCAFLTLDDAASHGIVDDDLTYEPLRQLGWQVEAVPWRRPGVAWDKYDAVVIRSTWDYIEAPNAFLAVLNDIEQAGTPLFNALDLVRWNIQKTYLRDLASWGVPVVPTVWRDHLRLGELHNVFEEVGAAEVVIKPVVGAGASGTYRLDAQSIRTQAAAIEAYYADRALMAQPFLRAVTTEGEFSLLYFNGVHSHTILKTPKTGDFRVQTAHGGSLRTVHADDTLLAAGATVLRALGEPLLYARTDFVRANDGENDWLVELELIEPSLYLRMDLQAPGRFARALHHQWAMRHARIG